MRYVIDASVGFKWEVAEIDSDKADRLRQAYRNAVHELLAPDHFPAELGNAFLIAERRGRVLPGQGRLLLGDALLTMPRLNAAVPDLLPRAFDIAARMQQTVYDCLYVALAEREQCELVTADDKLVRTLQPQFPFIVALASLP